MRVLGIDPGLGIIGFALLEAGVLLDYGVIRTEKQDLAHRLYEIQQDIDSLCADLRPDVAIVEELVFVQNVTTGMLVAQARGVILSILAKHGVPVKMVSAKEAKKSLTGSGNATKRDIQEAAKRLYNLKELPQPDDAADAIAIAACGSLPLHLRV